jgi:SAM-dependent methyltransferase
MGQTVSMTERRTGDYRGTAKPIPPDVVAYLRSHFQSGEHVLDIGCGLGQFLSASDIGIDADLFALRNSGKPVVQGNVAEALPFRDNTFDGVLAKDIIEHIDQPQVVLTEACRVSRKGARLILTTPRAVSRAVWDDYTHVRGFTRSALHSLLADTGWSDIRIHRFGSVPLAGRLGLVRFIPVIVALPGLGHYFGTNWFASASKA